MNSIKRCVVVGLIFLIGATNLAADINLSKINDNQILYKRDYIDQYVQRNRYEKLAIYSIMTSVVGSGIYYMLPHGGDSVTLSRTDFEAILASLKTISENSSKAVAAAPQAVVAQPVESNVFMSTFNSFKSTCGSLLRPVKDFVVYSAKLGWQGAVSSFLLHYMLAATRIPDQYLKPFKNFGSQLEHRAARLYDRLFFKPTLQWYITNHTHLKLNFKRLYTYAYVIEHHQFYKDAQSIKQDDVIELRDLFEQIEVQPSDEHIQLYYEKFKSVWSLCVHDIEGIIGFLEFKKTNVPDHADEYDYTIRAVRLIVENFIAMIESRYSDVWNTESTVTELSQEIKKFTHLLQVECDNCIIAEYAYA